MSADRHVNNFLQKCAQEMEKGIILKYKVTFIEAKGDISDQRYD
jgi:hypothetical protein